MSGPRLAVVRVRALPYDAGEPLRRAGGAEDGWKELVLDRPFTGPLLRLALREVPVRAAEVGVEALPRDRWADSRVKVGAPARDALPKLFARLADLRFLSGIGHA